MTNVFTCDAGFAEFFEAQGPANEVDPSKVGSICLRPRREEPLPKSWLKDPMLIALGVDCARVLLPSPIGGSSTRLGPRRAAKAMLHLV
mmetsp:Transcript_32173/g.74185  ORF Transcript_32173/g.74185 Transcript_32173/m.74185 type:complete len:89 (+) Transcript_32173:2123-2389(+)